MPRPLTLLALFFAGCVTKEDELASLDRDGDGFYHPAAEALGEAGPFDCDDADENVQGEATFFRDVDGDGFGDEGDAITDCAAPSGYVATSGDCDDTAFDVKPGASEVCNGADDDCDADIDDGLAGATYYPDEDEDGFGDDSLGVEACEAPEGWIAEGGDCDDEAAAVHPDAAELCNGEDDDCDGTPDDGLTVSTWYADADADGFGVDAETVEDCGPPEGYAAASGDCDDTSDAVWPGASEVPGNEADDDCDGGEVCWFDGDDDTYGGSSTIASDDVDCGDQSEATTSSDCDDSSSTVSPDGSETCNGVDDDCDGAVDDGVSSTWFVDADEDGFGTSATLTTCGRPSGTATVSGDCDDASAEDYPGAAEIAVNGDDEDCNGVESCYDDADEDGYGSDVVIDSTDMDCDDASESGLSGDCDDSDPLTNPDYEGWVGTGLPSDCSSGDPTTSYDIRAFEIDDGGGASDFGEDADLADFDGDGSADLLIAGFGYPSGSVALETCVFDGAAALASTVSLSSSDALWCVSCGTCLDPGSAFIPDLDGDGAPEVAVSAGGDLYVYTSATVASSTSSVIGGGEDFVINSVGNEDVTNVGDLDGDGWAEIAGGEHSVYVACGNDLAAMADGGPCRAFGDSTYVGADFNGLPDQDGDGYDDLIIGGAIAGNVYLIGGAANFGSTGSSQVDTDARATLSGTAYHGARVEGADFDADGAGDILVASNGIGTTTTYVVFGSTISTGSYTLSTSAGLTLTSDNALGAAVADIDADGAPDYLTTYQDDVLIFLGASWRTAGTLAIGDYDIRLSGYAGTHGTDNSEVFTGDIDGDGVPDILLTHPGSDTAVGYVSPF